MIIAQPEKTSGTSLALQYYAGHVGSGVGGDLVQDDNRNNCKYFFSFLNIISSYLKRLCALRFQALRIRIEIVLPVPPKMKTTALRDEKNLVITASQPRSQVPLSTSR